MIEGIHCYNILKNPKYYNDFQYRDANELKNDKEKEGHQYKQAQNDLIRQVLDLPYMSESMRNKFNFKVKGSKDS